jgi:hypothetical protein
VADPGVRSPGYELVFWSDRYFEGEQRSQGFKAPSSTVYPQFRCAKKGWTVVRTYHILRSAPVSVRKAPKMSMGEQLYVHGGGGIAGFAQEGENRGHERRM